MRKFLFVLASNDHLDDDKLRNRSICRAATHQPPARPPAA